MQALHQAFVSSLSAITDADQISMSEQIIGPSILLDSEPPSLSDSLRPSDPTFSVPIVLQCTSGSRLCSGRLQFQTEYQHVMGNPWLFFVHVDAASKRPFADVSRLDNNLVWQHLTRSGKVRGAIGLHPRTTWTNTGQTPFRRTHESIWGPLMLPKESTKSLILSTMSLGFFSSLSKHATPSM